MGSRKHTTPLENLLVVFVVTAPYDYARMMSEQFDRRLCLRRHLLDVFGMGRIHSTRKPDEVLPYQNAKF